MTKRTRLDGMDDDSRGTDSICQGRETDLKVAEMMRERFLAQRGQRGPAPPAAEAAAQPAHRRPRRPE